MSHSSNTLEKEFLKSERQSEVARILAAYRDYDEKGCPGGKWGATQPGNEAMAAERAALVQGMIAGLGLPSLADQRLLDVGAGTGHILEFFAGLGFLPGNLYGIDLIPERVAAARLRFPRFQLQEGNAEHLPFADGFFDVLVAFTLFSSILDPGMAQNVAAECARVLRPGGALIWYDFRYNNPANPNVRGMAFRRILALFPGFSCRLRTVTVLPPLARRLGRWTSSIYPLLARVPFLRTHYFGSLVKPGRGECPE